MSEEGSRLEKEPEGIVEKWLLRLSLEIALYLSVRIDSSFQKLLSSTVEDKSLYILLYSDLT